MIETYALDYTNFPVVMKKKSAPKPRRAPWTKDYKPAMARVTLIPMGDKIKFRVHGNVRCLRQEHRLMRKSFCTSNLTPYMSHKEVQKFLHRNRPKTVVMPLVSLGYDACEYVE